MEIIANNTEGKSGEKHGFPTAAPGHLPACGSVRSGGPIPGGVGPGVF